MGSKFQSRWAWGLAAIFVVTIGLTACQGETPQSGATSATETTGKIPTVEVNKLKVLLPDTVGQGKPVIVDVNSKFCLACQKIKPKLEALTQKNPAITLMPIDIQKPSPEQKTLLQALKVNTVPYVVFMDGNGKITQVFLEDAPQATLDKAAQTLVAGSHKPVEGEAPATPEDEDNAAKTENKG